MEKYKHVPPVVNLAIPRTRLNEMAAVGFGLQLSAVVAASFVYGSEALNAARSLADIATFGRPPSDGGDNNNNNGSSWSSWSCITDSQILMGASVAVLSSLVACRVVVACGLSSSGVSAQRAVDLASESFPALPLIVAAAVLIVTKTISNHNNLQRVLLIVVWALTLASVTRHLGRKWQQNRRLSMTRSSMDVAMASIRSSPRLQNALTVAPFFHLLWVVTWLVGISGAGQFLLFGRHSQRDSFGRPSSCTDDHTHSQQSVDDDQQHNRSALCIDSRLSYFLTNESGWLVALPATDMLPIVECGEQQVDAFYSTGGDSGGDSASSVSTAFAWGSVNGVTPNHLEGWSTVLGAVAFVVFAVASLCWTERAYRNALQAYAAITVARWWKRGPEGEVDDREDEMTSRLWSLQTMGSMLFDSLYVEALQFARMLVKYRRVAIQKLTKVVSSTTHNAAATRRAPPDNTTEWSSVTGLDSLDSSLKHATAWAFVNVGLSIENGTNVDIAASGARVCSIFEKEAMMGLFEEGEDTFSGGSDWLFWMMVRFVMATTSAVLAAVATLCVGYSLDASGAGNGPSSSFGLFLPAFAFVGAWILSSGHVAVFEGAQRSIIVCLVQSFPPEDDFKKMRLAFGLRNALKEASPNLWKASESRHKKQPSAARLDTSLAGRR